MGFNTKNHHCKGGDCMCVGGELRVVRDGKLVLEEGAVVEDPSGVLGGGSGLPSGSSPNQYLVTDGEGNAGWADLVAWEETKLVSIASSSGETAVSSEYGTSLAYFAEVPVLAGVIKKGEVYVVKYNGVQYTCKAVFVGYNSMSMDLVCLGNPSLIGSIATNNIEDNGMPFAILTASPETYIPLVCTAVPTAFTVDVGRTSHKIHTLDARFLSDGYPYTEYAVSDTLIDETEITGQKDFEDVQLVHGKPYKVVYDGEEFIETAGGNEYNPTVDNDFVPFRIRSEEYQYTWSTTITPKDSGTHTVAIYELNKIPHPLSPSLGGMPTLAEDGSDAGKSVKVNESGSGYELSVPNPMFAISADLIRVPTDDEDEYVFANIKNKYTFEQIKAAIYGDHVVYGTVKVHATRTETIYDEETGEELGERTIETVKTHIGCCTYHSWVSVQLDEVTEEDEYLNRSGEAIVFSLVTYIDDGGDFHKLIILWADGELSVALPGE